jgi:hypothetical protein
LSPKRFSEIIFDNPRFVNRQVFKTAKNHRLLIIVIFRRMFLYLVRKSLSARLRSDEGSKPEFFSVISQRKVLFGKLSGEPDENSFQGR